MTLDPAELEGQADRALKALPTPVAPPALLSRVMVAVHAGAAGHGADAAGITGVLEWPLALKVGLTLLSAALIVGALALWPRLIELARPGWESPVVVLLRVVVSAVRPLLPAALLYLAAMCAAAAAAVSLLKHVALGGVSQS